MASNLDAQIPPAEVPKWLNEDFFIDIVENETKLEKENFDLTIKSITPAVGKGENYTSILYRVQIDIKRHDKEENEVLAVIVKALLELTPEMEQFGVFPKEMAVYEDIIPSFEKEWKNINHEVKFAPRCLKSTTNPTRIMILDDLKFHGYKMQNRFKGLDMEHSKIFLTKLAKFHASSAVQYEKRNHDFGKRFHESFFREEARTFFKMWMDSTTKFFIEAMENDAFCKKYVHKIEKFPERGFDEGLKLTAVDNDKFNVLNHADAWLNNFLFSYDENENPKDCLFIDFQGTFYAPPAVDLFYFFVSSTSNEIREHGFDELIQHYHTVLVESLKKLNYPKKMPTLKEFHMDLLDRGFFGAYCTIGILAIVLLDSCEEAKFESFIRDDEEGQSFKRKMYNNPRYLEAMRFILPFLDRRGLLDM